MAVRKPNGCSHASTVIVHPCKVFRVDKVDSNPAAEDIEHNMPCRYTSSSCFHLARTLLAWAAPQGSRANEKVFHCTRIRGVKEEKECCLLHLQCAVAAMRLFPEHVEAAHIQDLIQPQPQNRKSQIAKSLINGRSSSVLFHATIRIGVNRCEPCQPLSAGSF